MARSQKDAILRMAMCHRFQALAEKHLKISVKDLSDRLGYSNTTVLRRVWKGEVFPDTERLAMLATIKTSRDYAPNIHWLITGEGNPMIAIIRKAPSRRGELMKVVKSLSESKTDSLLDILGNDT